MTSTSIQCHPLRKIASRLALSACVLAGSLATHAAHASVVTVDFSSNPFSTVPYDLDGVYLNVVTGAASATSFAGYDINPYFSGTGTAAALFRLFTPSTGGVVGSAGVAQALTAGTSIGASSTFISGVSNATLSASGTGYFGFKFVNEGTGLTNYGYLTVSETLPIGAGSVRLLSYSYENTGASITVSAVPEASTYAMLALGLVGIGAVVRRRTSTAASS